MKSYTITLTNREARLCRDAAKAEGESLLLVTGDNTLNRGEWLCVIDWLDWRLGNIDDESTLAALVKLANQIHSVVGARLVETPAEDSLIDEPATGCLF